MTKNFGVNDGHTIKGPGTGAVGRVVESVETRKIGAEVRRLFKERGHNAINCTIDEASSTSRGLELIIQQANRQDIDWFISIHLNAGRGRGVEVYTYKGRQYEDALNVCKNIAALGFVNRGVKDGTGLYVIKKTVAKSMLIEVCFVDSDDIDRYDQLSYTEIARAIVDGVIGTIEAPVNPIPSKPSGDEWVRRLQGVIGASVDGIPGPETLSKCPLLRYNSRGDVVKLMQEKLVSLGYNTNGVDGIFGNGTKNAVIQFQRSRGLVADGIVGPNTWKALIF